MPTIDSKTSNPASPTEEPRGILKNAPPRGAYDSPATVAAQAIIDKKVVLENTEKNSRKSNSYSSTETNNKNGDVKDTLEQKKTIDNNNTNNITTDKDNSNAHLKWDEENISEYEKSKTPKMKITEPDTPYAGSIEPEYYGDLAEEVPDLDIGEPEAPALDNITQNDRIIIDPSNVEEDDSDDLDSKKHDVFNERRKLHYDAGGEALKLGRKLVETEDEDEDEDEDDNDNDK